MALDFGNTRAYPNHGYRLSVDTVQDSIEVLRREFANVWCNRPTLYWYNMGTERAWFDDPQLLRAIGALNRIAEENLSKSRRSRAQIAVIVEPKTFAYTKPMMSRAEQTEMMTDLMYGQREQITRLGAPVDFHLASDFSRADMPDYKLYIFFNTLYLSASDRAAVTRELQGNKATALWFYAPGIVTDDSLSIEAASQLTGITLRAVGSTVVPAIELAATRFPAAPRRFGTRKSPGLILYTDDAEAETWGTLNVENKIGLSAKTVGDWRSIFCSVPIVPAEVLCQIARDAGVHIYNASDDALYACEDFVALHAKAAGEKNIKLPFTARVYDLFENKKISDATSEIRYQSAGRDTRLFRVERIEKEQ